MSSKIIYEQFLWFQNQIKSGRLNLTIPVADFREIKREILKYGSQVEVLSPKALRTDIKKEIEKMRKIYPVRD
jgi:predicted DNA-binding transcriptional regulator YafY